MKNTARRAARADTHRLAEEAFRSFQKHGQGTYPSMVRQLEKDLPEVLSFFSFPRHRWK
jgi:transposase-like protein